MYILGMETTYLEFWYLGYGHCATFQPLITKVLPNQSSVTTTL